MKQLIGRLLEFWLCRQALTVVETIVKQGGSVTFTQEGSAGGKIALKATFSATDDPGTPLPLQGRRVASTSSTDGKSPGKKNGPRRGR